MIFDLIIGGALGLIRGLLDAVLPVGSAPSLPSFTGLIQWYGWLRTIFAVDAVLQVLALAVGLMLLIGTLRIALFVYKRLPFGLGGT